MPLFGCFELEMQNYSCHIEFEKINIPVEINPVTLKFFCKTTSSLGWESNQLDCKASLPWILASADCRWLNHPCWTLNLFWYLSNTVWCGINTQMSLAICSFFTSLMDMTFPAAALWGSRENSWIEIFDVHAHNSFASHFDRHSVRGSPN